MFQILTFGLEISGLLAGGSWIAGLVGKTLGAAGLDSGFCVGTAAFGASAGFEAFDGKPSRSASSFEVNDGSVEF